MRQLFVKVPEGQGEKVIDLARQQAGVNLAVLPGHEDQDDWDIVMVHMPNRQVAYFLEELDALAQAQITLIPQGVLPMTPPDAKVADEITDVSSLSPVEIWLNALQSIGSWWSFLGYTVAAGVVVWAGMFTNTIYLLVAAMLIAPFAGPAMNTAIATSTGDVDLLWRSLLRYAVSILVMICTTVTLSIILQLRTASGTMVDVSEVSSMAVLLPLAAGAAGALNLALAERSSLVSGTAVGVLVAASLAPPAGLIGMAAAIGRWDMTLSAAFVLGLQLLAINLGGTVVLRLFGLNTSGTRYQRGSRRLFYASVAVSIVLLGLLLAWQFTSPVELQRSTITGRAVGVVEETLNESELAELVEANLRFTRPSNSKQKTLLGIIYVQRREGMSLSDEEIQRRLQQQLQADLTQFDPEITPLLQVSVLSPGP
ncbi:MAG: DUF389 domain-containing protein [Caldilineaceae bacterium]|nr:DUF389 domain-containing protein [Caldilineaceae bacterium]